MPEVAHKDLCSGCKQFRDIAYLEQGTNRSFCYECALQLPPTSEELALLFLSLTVPFKVGDRVEVRTGAVLLEGVGVVEEISTSLEHGATMVYPTFRVKIEEKAYPEAPDEEWTTEICLTRVKGNDA